MNKRIIGANAEGEAARFLEQNGYAIIQQNFVCRFGEIDIIARDGAYLCFVEVKYRKNLEFGSGLEAVNMKKQHKIIKCAQFFMIRNNIDCNSNCRFDVIAVENNKIEIIKNAFGVM